MTNLLRICLMLLAAGGAVLTSACATVINGKDQSLKFETDPSEAQCTLTQSNMEIAKFKTPNSVVLKRANSPIIMACTKDGYHETRALIGNTVSGAAWGNLAVGGIFGVLIDTQSGAAFRYYDPPKFTMIAAAGSPPEVSQTVATGITILPPGSPPTGQTAPTAAQMPQTAPTAAPAGASSAPLPVASTGTAAPAPVGPGSGMSRSRL